MAAQNLQFRRPTSCFQYSEDHQAIVYPEQDQKFVFKSQTASAKHHRSRSAPVFQPSAGVWGDKELSFRERRCFTGEKNRRWACMLLTSTDAESESSHHQSRKRRIILEQDVEELQTRLQDERDVRRTLERALKSSSYELGSPHCKLSPQTKQLIKEIAGLELEVVNLEKQALTLYRKVFDARISKSPASEQNAVKLLKNQDTEEISSKIIPHRKKKSYSFHHHRRQVSATSQGCHSLQENLSFSQNKTRHASLFGGKCSIDEEAYNAFTKEGRGIQFDQTSKDARVWPSVCEIEKKETTSLKAMSSPYSSSGGGYSHNTPSKLSEEMVRCMASIYCKLADPSLTYTGDNFSPPSSSTSASSVSTFARELSSDGWSPRFKSESIKPSPMIQVPWIRVDKERLSYAARALRNFRSMVEQLERVDPGQMKHNEKLAFWMNIYNALVMHAYLAYGIARSHLKRISLLQKAAYKIGSHSINAYTIQHTILGCRPQRPAQWLQTLFTPLAKLKTEDRRAYALNNPEPLVCFALCSGGQSDPVVRAYTAKNVKMELESAKRDFLHVSISIRNDKIQLPKMLESYGKDIGINGCGKMVEWVCENVCAKQQASIKSCSENKSNKSIEWISYDFNFRYLFVAELGRTSISV